MPVEVSTFIKTGFVSSGLILLCKCEICTLSARGVLHATSLYAPVKEVIYKYTLTLECLLPHALVLTFINDKVRKKDLWMFLKLTNKTSRL